MNKQFLIERIKKNVVDINSYSAIVKEYTHFVHEEHKLMDTEFATKFKNGEVSEELHKELTRKYYFITIYGSDLQKLACETSVFYQLLVEQCIDDKEDLKELFTPEEHQIIDTVTKASLRLTIINGAGVIEFKDKKLEEESIKKLDEDSSAQYKHMLMLAKVVKDRDSGKENKKG